MVWLNTEPVGDHLNAAMLANVLDRVPVEVALRLEIEQASLSDKVWRERGDEAMIYL